MITFDFDLTLVNTQPVEKLRTERKWKEIMARAGRLEVYPEISELLKKLVIKNQALAIVTSSPDMIPRYFIRQYEWPIDIVLGYHQVSRKKPDPEGLYLAMEKAGASPEKTFHIGDQPEDTQASKAANVTAIGAGWGLADTLSLEESAPELFLRISCRTTRVSAENLLTLPLYTGFDPFNSGLVSLYFVISNGEKPGVCVVRADTGA